jgi:hypothetical protein
MSQSKQHTDTGGIDTDEHTASDTETADNATTGGAYVTCRTCDDLRRARTRGLTAGPVVRSTDE